MCNKYVICYALISSWRKKCFSNYSFSSHCKGPNNLHDIMHIYLFVEDTLKVSVTLALDTATSTLFLLQENDINQLLSV